MVVIEDERDLQEVLAYNLRGAGHEVIPALAGKEGLKLVREHRPALPW